MGSWGGDKETSHSHKRAQCVGGDKEVEQVEEVEGGGGGDGGGGGGDKAKLPQLVTVQCVGGDKEVEEVEEEVDIREEKKWSRFVKER